MSIEVNIWRIDESNVPIALTGIDLERRLQEIIATDVSLLDPELLIIGREVQTQDRGRIDLLAIDRQGSLVVIELKRSRTPREVVAQILDYGSWVSRMTPEDVQRVYSDYQDGHRDNSAPRLINEALKDKFNSAPVELNATHRLVIVASELDPATERIVTYLRDEYELDINVAFFHALNDEGRTYLTRAWLREDSPGSHEPPGARREWNGQFYVNFEEGEERKWEEARRYGFVSAGGGDRFTRFMKQLPVGSRFWAYAPGWGYVGVGEVTAEAVHFSEFKVNVDGTGERHFTEVGSEAPEAFNEKQHFVAVNWLKTVSLNDAVREPGLFANQNTVAKPRDPKWQATVELLQERWGIA